MNSAETGSDPISPLSLRSRVARRILVSIFREQVPAGSRLVIQKLANQYGVSSTPVREAIVFLESVGLVEFEHNRGAVVKAFGPVELREIYQMRRILEVEATRAACTRIDRAEMEALKGEMVQLLAEGKASKKMKRWSEAEMDCDRRLHQLIADNCGSKRLRDEIQRYNTFMQAIRQIVGNQRGAQEVALGEHLAILDALIACDMYVACGEMAKHIDQTAQSVIKVMFPNATDSNQAKNQ